MPPLCFLTDVPPPASDSVSVVALNESRTVRVTWSRPTLGPGQVITGYSVQYRISGSTSYTTYSLSGSSTTYTIDSLNLGTAYEVRVALRGPLGLSGYCCGSGKYVTTYNREYRQCMRNYISLVMVIYILRGCGFIHNMSYIIYCT